MYLNTVYPLVQLLCQFPHCGIHHFLCVAVSHGVVQEQGFAAQGYLYEDSSLWLLHNVLPTPIGTSRGSRFSGRCGSSVSWQSLCREVYSGHTLSTWLMIRISSREPLTTVLQLLLLLWSLQLDFHQPWVPFVFPHTEWPVVIACRCVPAPSGQHFCTANWGTPWGAGLRL